MTTAAELRQEVGAGSSISDDTLERYLAMAAALVEEYIGSAADDVVIPDPLADHAELVCAAELFNMSRAPNGVLNQQYEATDGSALSVPVRISGDPLRPVRPLLATWVGGLTT